MSCDLLGHPDQPVDVVISNQCGALPTDPLGEDAISELLHDFLSSDVTCSMGRQDSWELQPLPSLPAATTSGTTHPQDPFDAILDLLSPTEHTDADIGIESMTETTTAAAAAAAFAVLVPEGKHGEAGEVEFEDLLSSDAATTMTGTSLLPWEIDPQETQHHHQSFQQEATGMLPLPPCPQQVPQQQHQQHHLSSCCDPCDWREHTVKHSSDSRGAPIMVGEAACLWLAPVARSVI
jgi:hypothetical protein